METLETTEQLSTRSVGVRYGLILAVISIAYFVILSVAGIAMEGAASIPSYLFIAVVVFLAHKYYKENGNGYLSIGQGIGIAFWTGLISSLVSSAFTYIYIKFIDASFMENLRNTQIENMQEQGMSEEQIDQAMQFAGAFMTPEMIAVFGIVGGIIAAIIIGLIISLFTKKSDPDMAV